MTSQKAKPMTLRILQVDVVSCPSARGLLQLPTIYHLTPLLDPNPHLLHPQSNQSLSHKPL